MNNDYKMVSVLLIEKGGEISETRIKDFALDTLYKKCRFRKPDGFERRALWNVTIKGETYIIGLFGKNNGKAGTENKYDMPPPVDTTLYFGPLLLVRFSNTEMTNVKDLSCEIWDMVYEKLFGGFENLSSTAQEDEEEEDELADLPSEMKTKNGYLKDGFIIDDSEQSSNPSTAHPSASEEEMTDEEYESELDFEEYEYMDSTEDEESDDEEECE